MILRLKRFIGSSNHRSVIETMAIIGTIGLSFIMTNSINMRISIIHSPINYSTSTATLVETTQKLLKNGSQSKLPLLRSINWCFLPINFTFFEIETKVAVLMEKYYKTKINFKTCKRSSIIDRWQQGNHRWQLCSDVAALLNRHFWVCVIHTEFKPRLMVVRSFIQKLPRRAGAMAQNMKKTMSKCEQLYEKLQHQQPKPSIYFWRQNQKSNR